MHEFFIKAGGLTVYIGKKDYSRLRLQLPSVTAVQYFGSPRQTLQCFVSADITDYSARRMYVEGILSRYTGRLNTQGYEGLISGRNANFGEFTTPFSEITGIRFERD